MKPLTHAKISAKKFGGTAADYIEIHNWFDQTKAHIADSRHRLVLHNSFGIFMCEQVFGEIVENNGKFVRMPYITNSNGKQISVRDIAENHVISDLGHIPTLADCLSTTPVPAEYVGGRVAEMVMSIPKNANYVLVD